MTNKININQINSYKKRINEIETQLATFEDRLEEPFDFRTDEEIKYIYGMIYELTKDLRNTKIDYLFELSKGA